MNTQSQNKRILVALVIIASVLSQGHVVNGSQFRKKWGTESYDLENKEFKLDFGRNVKINRIWGHASLAPRSCSLTMSGGNRVRQALLTLWSPQANTWDNVPSVSRTLGSATNTNNQVDNAIIAVILKQSGTLDSSSVVFEKNDVGTMKDLYLHYAVGWGGGTVNACHAPNPEIQMIIEYDNVV